MVEAHKSHAVPPISQRRGTQRLKDGCGGGEGAVDAGRVVMRSGSPHPPVDAERGRDVGTGGGEAGLALRRIDVGHEVLRTWSLKIEIDVRRLFSRLRHFDGLAISRLEFDVAGN